MHENFYITAAQVLPILLLALIWQSRYLENLRLQRRLLRRADPGHGVLFWTKPRVRVYAMTVVTVTLACLILCLLLLAGIMPDSIGLRLVVISGLALASASLLYRMWNEIRDATGPISEEASAPGESDAPPPATSHR
jgi:hypothetical protein